MPADFPFFHVALNLPHAGRIARRIALILPSSTESPAAETARRLTRELMELLEPAVDLDENPPPPGGTRIRDQAAALARQLVDAIEHGGFRGDRLGQCVRNLFECLELGREGALISLRAGENPASLQRPRPTAGG